MCSTKKSCTACELKISGRKKKKTMAKSSKKIQVDATNLVKQSAAGAVGFGLSNVVTKQVNNLMTEPMDKNISGLVKIAAGIATVAFSGKGRGGTTQLIQSAAGGMAVSGVLDLMKQNLPDSAQTFLGLAGATTLLNGGRRKMRVQTYGTNGIYGGNRARMQARKVA